ncbi:DDE-type integrase/transposase/recombinase [Deinococcus sp. QL22]|uniref:DDE-type integrase/transposase/recombinase n=1 Tax=Deinococcus sp. QL22 TaxID=2939437 RepID=UPI00352FFBA8
MSVIQHAVWLSYRFPLRDWNGQDLLRPRGTLVSHQTLCEWCITQFFSQGRRQREPRRGCRWPVDELCITVEGSRTLAWRAVDEQGFILDSLLQRHRDTDAAIPVLTKLLGEYSVPEVIHTDHLRSDGAAIRKGSS